MGMLGNGCAFLTGTAIGAAADKAERTAQMIKMMKGKTPEQQMAIRFFLDDSMGCGKKIGGCTGKNKVKGFKLPRMITVQEYQQMVQQKVNSFDLQQMAISALGIDYSEVSEVKPLKLNSYSFFDGESVTDTETTLTYVDRGILLTSTFEINIIFFGRNQLYTYTLEFSMISDDILEKTRDIFYQDIILLETVKKTKEKMYSKMTGCLKKKEKTQKQHYTIFKVEINLPGNSGISYTARDAKQANACAMAMKAMLRERKIVR